MTNPKVPWVPKRGCRMTLQVMREAPLRSFSFIWYNLLLYITLRLFFCFLTLVSAYLYAVTFFGIAVSQSYMGILTARVHSTHTVRNTTKMLANVYGPNTLFTGPRPLSTGKLGKVPMGCSIYRTLALCGLHYPLQGKMA